MKKVAEPKTDNIPFYEKIKMLNLMLTIPNEPRRVKESLRLKEGCREKNEKEGFFIYNYHSSPPVAYFIILFKCCNGKRENVIERREKR